MNKKFKKRFRKFKKFRRKRQSKSIGGILTRSFKVSKVPAICRFSNILQNDATATGIAIYAYRMYDPANCCFTGNNFPTVNTVTNVVNSKDQAVPGASEWAMYGNLYDMYRVMGFKFTYFPGATTDATGAAVDNTPFYTWWDPDNNTTSPVQVTTVTVSPTTSQYYLNYNSLRTHSYVNIKDKIKRYVKLPKMTAIATSAFAPSNVDQNGFINCSSTASPINGLFYWYFKQDIGTKYALNSAIGIALVEYYILFKFRV